MSYFAVTAMALGIFIVAPALAQESPYRFKRGFPANEETIRRAQDATGKGWFAVVRMYGPEEPIFDGTYRLPDVERVE